MKKRGDEYEEIKKSIGQRMIDQVSTVILCAVMPIVLRSFKFVVFKACQLYPSIKDHIEFVEIGQVSELQDFPPNKGSLFLLSVLL